MEGLKVERLRLGADRLHPSRRAIDPRLRKEPEEFAVEEEEQIEQLAGGPVERCAAKAHDAPYPVGIRQRRVLADPASQGVSDKHGPIDPEGVQNRHDVVRLLPQLQRPAEVV
jgi:hypothetical protein